MLPHAIAIDMLVSTAPSLTMLTNDIIMYTPSQHKPHTVLSELCHMHMGSKGGRQLYIFFCCMQFGTRWYMRCRADQAKSRGAQLQAHLLV